MLSQQVKIFEYFYLQPIRKLQIFYSIPTALERIENTPKSEAKNQEFTF